MTQPMLIPIHGPTCKQSLHVPPTDPNVQRADVKRLSGQNAAILARLKEGPATNVELAEMSKKYTGRVSDLRKHGHAIKCTRTAREGVTVYTLEGVE